METLVKESEFFSNKISERIWGHRFKDGQRGVEYVLEFLNVIAGANYKLDATHYQRKKMEHFRKFIFEGEKDGRATKGEAKHVTLLLDDKNKIISNLGISENDLDDLQLFFKNLKVEILKAEGKSVDRSWYAHPLFPLNESLLFFELRSDKDSSDFERNFFARGGELYYLMLTYGTEHDLNLRSSLENKFKSLMQGNKNIGKIVDTLCESLNESATYDFDNLKGIAPLQKKEELISIYPAAKKSKYPTLPDKKVHLYNTMAKDLDALLEIEVDIYEVMGMLTSLINFHIYSYMINQTSKDYTIFMDCMDGANPHIKRLAHYSYKDNDRLVKECFDKQTDITIQQRIPHEHALQKITEWKKAAAESNAAKLTEKYTKFFEDIEYKSLQEKSKLELINTLVDNNEQAYRLLQQKIREIARKDLKDQYAILNTLSRDGGFMIMGRGVPARYILSDSLLSAFVYSILNKSLQMTFQDFKKQLFEQYKIVIAEDEAMLSGIYETEKINLRCFKLNGEHLRSKLRKNGLLEEYSDATALIKNPYYSQGVE